MTRNQLMYWQNVETERSNKAREAETHRYNTEYLKELNRSNVTREQETERHNRAMELLTNQSQAEVARHNSVTELQTDVNLAEQQRSHQANEALQTRQIGLGYANLGLGYGQLSELIRHNQAGEKAQIISLNQERDLREREQELSQERLAEEARSNRAQEQSNLLNWIARTQATSETIRTNVANENLREKEMHIKAFGTAGNVLNDALKTGTAIAK